LVIRNQIAEGFGVSRVFKVIQSGDMERYLSHWNLGDEGGDECVWKEVESTVQGEPKGIRDVTCLWLQLELCPKRINQKKSGFRPLTARMDSKCKGCLSSLSFLFDLF